MFAKRIARDLVKRLPWHLRRIANATIMNWGARKPPFQGVYRSFEEVRGTIPETDQASSATVRKHECELDGSPLGLRRLGRGRSLSLVVAALRFSDGSTFRILDFGGGGAADYSSLLAAIGNEANVNYTVVELPAVCEAGRQLWADDPRIKYVEKIPEEETYDLTYTWGGIQYHPDVYGLISEMARRARKAVLLVGSPFSNRDFVRAQVNQSRSYPNWVISLPRTREIMASLGFDLALAAAGEEEYNVENYEPEYRVPSSATLLFLRRQ
jgi:putative methyltransferase (TIGR04325 family)